MLKRLNALILADLAGISDDPDFYILERLERLRAAIHQSDDPEHRKIWEAMEKCLDDVLDQTRIFRPPSSPRQF